MNGPAPVAFTIAMPGCSFQELAKNDGRLMPVLHLTRDSYVSPNSTFPTAPVLSPGRLNSWRPWIRESVIDRLLTQFHRPSRSGVAMVIVVRRVSLNNFSVSGVAPPGTSKTPVAWWNCWSLLKVNPGDHVIQDVMFTADGVRLIVGNVCEMLADDRSW